MVKTPVFQLRLSKHFKKSTSVVHKICSLYFNSVIGLGNRQWSSLQHSHTAGENQRGYLFWGLKCKTEWEMDGFEMKRNLTVNLILSHHHEIPEMSNNSKWNIFVTITPKVRAVLDISGGSALCLFGRLQECGRDSGMPKAQLPSAWGTESQGDGYRSSRVSWVTGTAVGYYYETSEKPRTLPKLHRETGMDAESSIAGMETL